MCVICQLQAIAILPQVKQFLGNPSEGLDGFQNRSRYRGWSKMKLLSVLRIELLQSSPQPVILLNETSLLKQPKETA
jgi:hypothetical protein